MLIQYANSTAYLLEEVRSAFRDAVGVIGNLLKPVNRYTHRVQNQFDAAEELTNV